MATKAERCAGSLMGRRVSMPGGLLLGTIIGAKAGPMMLDADNVMSATKRYRIQPPTGRAFWTQPVCVTEVP